MVKRIGAPSMMRTLLLVALAAALTGCAMSGADVRHGVIELPLQKGWYEGKRVFYVTTDVSDADVAAEAGVNFVPRLADALPPPDAPPGTRTAVERIYKITNFDQGNVLPSAPVPTGAGNRDTSYSPVWVLVKVTWSPGADRRELRSEEQVLEAAERGRVTLERTRIVVNCPVVMTEQGGTLRGARVIE